MLKPDCDFIPWEWGQGVFDSDDGSVSGCSMTNLSSSGFSAWSWTFFSTTVLGFGAG